MPTDVDRGRAQHNAHHEDAHGVDAHDAPHLGEQQLRGIVEHSPDAITLANESGCIVEWNRAAAELTGIDRSAALGRSLWDVQYELLPQGRRTPDALPRQRAAILNACRTGLLPFEGQPVEMQLRRADGELRFVQQKVFAIQTSGGYMLGSVTRDVTDRVRAEAEAREAAAQREQADAERESTLAALNEANERLEMRVAERTAELERLYAQARFEQARWEAAVESMLDPVTVANPDGQAIYMNAAYNRWVARTIDPGRSLSEQADFYQLYRPDGTLFPPEDLPLQRAALRDEDVRDVEVVQRTPDGEERIALWNASPLHDARGRVLGSVAVGRDITGQRRAEAEKRAADRERERLLRRVQGYAAELRTGNEQLLAMTQALQTQAQELLRARAELEVRVWQRTRHLEILHAIDQDVLAARSPAEIAHTVASHLRKILPCERAALIVFDFGASMAQVLAIDTEAPSIFQAGQRLPLEAFGAFPERQPPAAAYVPDLASAPDLTSVQQSLRAEGIRSHLWVPLAMGNKVVGTLALAASALNAFTPEHIATARQIADSLAVAMQNALLNEQVRQSREQLQTLSQRLAEDHDSERRYVAGELYDDAGQRLAALALGLSAVAQQVRYDPAAAARLEELRELAASILGDLHTLAVHLRPASLDRLGLLPALRQYVNAFATQHGINVQMETLGVSHLPLPSHAAAALYWIAQELLDNILRHARAQHAGLIVEQRNDRLIMIVEDDGVGFDAEAALRQAGLGLFGVRERATTLSGMLTIESSPGRGATVYVDIPYVATSSEE